MFKNIKEGHTPDSLLRDGHPTMPIVRRVLLGTLNISQKQAAVLAAKIVQSSLEISAKLPDID